MKRFYVGLVRATLVLALLPLTISVGGISLFTPDAALLPLVLVWGTHVAAMRARRGWRVPVVRGERAITVLVIATCAIVPFSYHLANSSDAALFFLRMAAFYFVVRWLLARGWLLPDQFLRWSVQFAVFLIAIGLIQLLTGTQVGLVANYFGESASEAGAFGATRRLSGTSPNSNVFGQWIVMFGLALNFRLIRGSRLPHLFFLAVVVLVEARLIAATLSRSALLFFVVSNVPLAAMWVWRSPRSRFVQRVVGAAIIAAILTAGIGIGWQRLNEVSLLAERMDAYSNVRRVTAATNGLILLQDPWIAVTGTGWGAFYPALDARGLRGLADDPILRWRDIRDWQGEIHNTFLMVLVEGGIVTFLPFVVLCGVVVLSIHRCVRRNSDPALEEPAFMGILIVAYGLVPMQFTTAATTPWIMPFLVTLCALVFDMIREPAYDRMPREERAVGI